jgi:hypothetical protein
MLENNISETGSVSALMSGEGISYSVGILKKRSYQSLVIE